MPVNLNKKITHCSGCGKSFDEVEVHHFAAIKNGRFITNQADKEAIRTAVCVECESKGLSTCTRCQKVHYAGSLGECFKVGDKVETIDEMNLHSGTPRLMNRAEVIRLTPKLYITKNQYGNESKFRKSDLKCVGYDFLFSSYSIRPAQSEKGAS